MKHNTQDTELAQRTCVPCAASAEPLKDDALDKLMELLPPGWLVVDQHHLEKQYKFRDFRDALDFVNKVGQLAESIGHHPDIYLSWGKVKLMIFTHKLNGLHENDFIFAAKADELYTKP